MMENRYVSLRILTLIVFLLGFINICASENVKKSIDDNRDDTGETGDEAKDESLDIPIENEPTNLTCTRRSNSQMHEIRSAHHRQFPFVAAIMTHQNEYACAGCIVSNGIVLTTATCIQQPISYVLLNVTKAVKDETAVMLHVTKTEKFPTFTGSEALKNVGIIYTEKHNNSIASKIRLSNFTSAQNIVDLTAIGFGLNADIGQVKQLQYVGLEKRGIVIPGEPFKAYFDCVETKVLTCFKDMGGPVIFDNELMGIVMNGQEDCNKEISGVYAINKIMASVIPTYTFKAWLDERIVKNENQNDASLQIYPNKPQNLRIGKLPTHKMTSSDAGDIMSALTQLMVLFLFCIVLVF